jgi:bacterioferritin
MLSGVMEQGRALDNYFVRDADSLRQSAQACLAEGSYSGNDKAIELLQTVLATEIICVLRYTRISVSEACLKNVQIGAEFQEQANDERRHMVTVARRIEELGGEPNFAPKGLVSRTAVAHGDSENFSEMAQYNLIAERSIIEHYKGLIAYFKEHDPASRELLETILQDEENHTADMQDLLMTRGDHNISYTN